jgi:heptosyltransferase-3
MPLSDRLEKVLLVRTDRLGDVILTLPMVSELRKVHPGTHVSMLLRPYTGAIVEGHAGVEEILWDDGRYKTFLVLLRALRLRRFDAAVLVHPTLRLALMLFLAGVPVRIGSGYRVYSFLLNVPVHEHRKDARRHELEYNLNLLAPLGVTASVHPGSAEFGVVVPRSAQRRAEEKLRDAGLTLGSAFVIIHPGSGKSAREWPLEKFCGLGRLIHDRTGLLLLVTGIDAERGLAQALTEGIGKGAVSAAGEFSLQELAAVIKRAALWIGHSTGPLHLAVALGTPVVGLYPQLRPMSAQRWGPFATQCRVHVPAKPENCRECGRGDAFCACMDTISVEEVFHSVEELLADTRKKE